jgi:GR25 family glycosyltransferase involved in LPS biosynthesis
MFNVGFYCINFKDEKRREKMMNRWEALELDLHFVPPVECSDKRLTDLEIDIANEKRTWAIMLQHLDSIRHFIENTDKKYCVVCEDDILVSKYLKVDLVEIIQTYEKLDLDVMLLGYLVPYTIHDENHHYPLKERNHMFSYHDYPNDLWGSQMYMVSRKHGQKLLDKYTIHYALQTIDENTPFSPDWTLTKFGNNAIVYPMIALEEGDTKCDLDSEITFHQKCFKQNYVARVFI